MKFFIDILKGMVIGLANIIPGVSGGTMMVSMGIYDTLIYCITHLFKQFKKSLMTLLPFVVGMIAALAILSNVITWALMDEFASLPTNTLFIGLILGGLPAIFKQIKGSKKRDSILGGILFVLFFALVIFMATLKETQDTGAVISLSVLEVLKLTLMGCIASATMVIPGHCNERAFGPPWSFTSTSSCSWLGHMVSGLWPLTSFALFRLGFPTPPTLNVLSSLVTITRRTVLQKVRYHPLTGCNCL